jgi:transposase
MQITTIGLDIAKNVFQVHGIDTAEKVVVRRQLRRSQVLAFFKPLPPCLIGLEPALPPITGLVNSRSSATRFV